MIETHAVFDLNYYEQSAFLKISNFVRKVMKLTQSQSHLAFSGYSNISKFIFCLSLLIFFTSDVPNLLQFKLDLSDVCLDTLWLLFNQKSLLADDKCAHSHQTQTCCLCLRPVAFPSAGEWCCRFIMALCPRQSPLMGYYSITFICVKTGINMI